MESIVRRIYDVTESMRLYYLVRFGVHYTSTTIVIIIIEGRLTGMNANKHNKRRATLHFPDLFHFTAILAHKAAPQKRRKEKRRSPNNPHSHPYTDQPPPLTISHPLYMIKAKASPRRMKRKDF